MGIKRLKSNETKLLDERKGSKSNQKGITVVERSAKVAKPGKGPHESDFNLLFGP